MTSLLKGLGNLTQRQDHDTITSLLQGVGKLHVLDLLAVLRVGLVGRGPELFIIIGGYRNELNDFRFSSTGYRYILLDFSWGPHGSLHCFSRCMLMGVLQWRSLQVITKPQCCCSGPYFC